MLSPGTNWDVSILALRLSLILDDTMIFEYILFPFAKSAVSCAGWTWSTTSRKWTSFWRMQPSLTSPSGGTHGRPLWPRLSFSFTQQGQNRKHHETSWNMMKHDETCTTCHRYFLSEVLWCSLYDCGCRTFYDESWVDSLWLYGLLASLITDTS